MSVLFKSDSFLHSNFLQIGDHCLYREGFPTERVSDTSLPSEGAAWDNTCASTVRPKLRTQAKTVCRESPGSPPRKGVQIPPTRDPQVRRTSPAPSDFPTSSSTMEKLDWGWGKLRDKRPGPGGSQPSGTGRTHLKRAQRHSRGP